MPEHTFSGAAQAAAHIMAQSSLQVYRITYTTGTFLTYWSGENSDQARELCAAYYHISPERLVAQLEK